MISKTARFQASVAGGTELRPSLLLDVTRRILVVGYRRFGTSPIHWNAWHFQMELIGCREALVTNHTLRRVTSQKSENLDHKIACILSIFKHVSVTE